MKLTKAEKKKLKREKRLGTIHALNNHLDIDRPRAPLRLTLIIIILVGLCATAYFNMLSGAFLIVDDRSAFVENTLLRSLPQSMQTFFLQNIIYSIVYNLFGVNAVPLHLISLIFHIGNSVFTFYLLLQLFDRKVATIAAALFAVHPVNTEAVSWISGGIYLYNAIFIYLLIFFYVLYKKTMRKRYLIAGFIVLCFTAIFLRGIWVIVSLLAIGVLDYTFFYQPKINKVILKVLPVALLLLICLGVIFRQSLADRLAIRKNPSVINQESLMPVIQSYPYTISTMVRLYVFPKDLTTYYDGNPLSIFDQISMYSVFVLYCGLIVFLWNRKKEYAGILILLLVFIAPALSPIPITWYMAERYLYFGTPFFCVLMALLFMRLENWIKIRQLSIMLTCILLLIYSLRTISRNKDWQTSQTIALVTIKTSPYTPRPYIDLGAAYFLKKKIDLATKYYKKSLTISVPSATAENSLGLIYLQYGLPTDVSAQKDLSKSQQAYQIAINRYKDHNVRGTIFALAKAIEYNPDFYDAREALGDIYVGTNKYAFAAAQYEKCLKIDPQKDTAYFKLAFIEHELKHDERARELVTKSLELNPGNQDATQLLQKINTPT